jgi:hypothetical protein
MSIAAWYAFRLSSKRCSTREDLRRLKARIETARRNVRNLDNAAVKAIDSGAPQEESKQSSDARKSICYAIDAHPANRRSATPGARQAA